MFLESTKQREYYLLYVLNQIIQKSNYFVCVLGCKNSGSHPKRLTKRYHLNSLPPYKHPKSSQCTTYIELNTCQLGLPHISLFKPWHPNQAKDSNLIKSNKKYHDWPLVSLKIALLQYLLIYMGHKLDLLYYCLQ